MTASVAELIIILRGEVQERETRDVIVSYKLLAEAADALEAASSKLEAANSKLEAANARVAKLEGAGHRYRAPLLLAGGMEAVVQVRFVPRDYIHNKPTEANPSPIRVLLVGDIERAQPHGEALSAAEGEE